jgi:hypothetical protein
MQEEDARDEQERGEEIQRGVHRVPGDDDRDRGTEREDRERHEEPARGAGEENARHVRRTS